MTGPDAADPSGGEEPAGEERAGEERAGDVAELFLGNIMYALERCALSLEEESKREDAAFYRGIARKLAIAHGRQKRR